MSRTPSIIAELDRAGVFRLPSELGEPYKVFAKYELGDGREPPWVGLARLHGRASGTEPWPKGPAVQPVGTPFGERLQTDLARPADILKRFIRLTTGDPEDVLEFVQEYGMLYLDQDGLPVGWLSNSAAVVAEPIAWYVRYARLAAATLRVAINLREMLETRCSLYPEDVRYIRDHWQRCADEQDAREDMGAPASEIDAMVPAYWSEIADMGAGRRHVVLKGAEQKMLLRHLVTAPASWWIHTSSARHQVAWREHGWVLQWNCGSAWGAIGRALGEAVTSITSGNICAFCSRPRRRRRYTSDRGLGRPCESKACVRRYERERKRLQRRP